MQLVTAGATDVTTYFMLRLAATGVEATGLTITNFDLQYTRSRTAPTAKVDATALAATDSAHADNQAIEIDSTDQPGLYRVDWPDAAFAAGVDEVYLTVKCATAFTETLRVRLMSATRGLAGTALPAAAADAAGGVPISDAGGLDLDAKLANTNEVTAARMGALTDWINGGRLDLILDIIAADTTTDIPALIAALQARLSPIVTKTGTVATDAGNSATTFVTDLTESANDYWKDAFLRLTSGALINQVKKIAGYNGTTKAVTVAGGFTATPADGVSFEVVND
jgi:hypothetical protein